MHVRGQRQRQREGAERGGCAVRHRETDISSEQEKGGGGLELCGSRARIKGRGGGGGAAAL